MAKKTKSSKSRNHTSYWDKIKLLLKNEQVHFMAGIIFILVGIYMISSLYSYINTGYLDQDIVESYLMQNKHAVNSGGNLGANLAYQFIHKGFGIASFFIPLYLILLGGNLAQFYKPKLIKSFFLCTISMIWCSVSLAFVFGESTTHSFFLVGGMHGKIVSNWLQFQVGTPGLIMILIACLICFCLFISKRTMIFLRSLFHPMLPSFSFLKRKKNKETTSTLKNNIPEQETNLIEELIEEDDNKKDLESICNENKEETVDDIMQKIAEATNTSVDEFKHRENSNNIDNVETTKEEENNNSHIIPTNTQETIESKKEPEFTIEAGHSPENEEYKGKMDTPYDPRLDLSHYQLPNPNLLKRFDDETPTINEAEQNENKRHIIEVLRSFGIEISTIKATVGPTITLYEIKPQSGIRISKIRGLEDDIALSLKAIGIRIIAPIPGKGTIGIEVPNANPQIVSMRNIIASKKYQETKYELPIAMGRTITNDVFMIDLAKMPHVLVAGATGQGKSVGLNAMITSLLYKKHPAELKFVLIDPKKVEFSIYSTIEKHFLAKLPDEENAIITDVKKVIQTLNSICVEMDTRYDLLKEAHVRNVKEYNKKFINRQLNPNNHHRYLPYIVVVIDEFGDLIMTAGKEVELPIARIAQLARAVGIHMIIATQRPTTNIITGTIKANFPARIAFKVSQMIDSRTILDRPGANQLIGRGDMLFLQNADPIRVQCAFVDTPEVVEVTDYIASQQGYVSAFDLPEYTIESKDENNTTIIDSSKRDVLFEDAARLIVTTQQASASMLQRKFSIGFNRAGRLIEQMEQAGIVGPPEGSKPRQVLCISESELEAKIGL